VAPMRTQEASARTPAVMANLESNRRDYIAITLEGDVVSPTEVDRTHESWTTVNLEEDELSARRMEEVKADSALKKYLSGERKSLLDQFLEDQEYARNERKGAQEAARKALAMEQRIEHSVVIIDLDEEV